MSYDDDMFGLHDFDGDGKISLYEESLSYSIYEEIFDEESIGGYASAYSGRSGLQSCVPKVPITKENYHRKKRELITSVVLDAIISVFISGLPLIVLAVVIETQLESDDSTWLVTLLFGGGALFVLWKIWRAFVIFAQSTRKDIKDAEEAFSKFVSMDERKK